MRVVVAGAALSGIAAAIALARRGHDVILLERDARPAPTEASAAYAEWGRPGVPHFRLPHAFLALGREVMRQHFPDVLDGLRAAGALELDISASAPEGVERRDDFHALACRRPVIEWVLRRAAAREDRIRMLTGVRVEGFVAKSGLRVTGVRTSDGSVVEADLVVDATGRSSRISRWLADVGAAPISEQMVPTGIVYYCRYFRFLRGGPLPTTMHPLGPRADLGHMAFGAFNGDNGTWAIVLSCPAWDPAYHALRDEATFEAALSTIVPVAPLVAPEVSAPITPVQPMGELRNVRRSLLVDGQPVATGVVAIGDVIANTDPMFAWGLSLGLANAVQLAEVVDAHGSDGEALAVAFETAAAPRADACYRSSRDADLARQRLWRGEAVDVLTPDGDLPLFVALTLNVAARRDAEIYVRTMRRQQLLDPLDDLPGDRPLLDRAAAIVAEMRRAQPPRRFGPSKDEMLAILAERAAQPS